jgi:hypothetical protein
MLLLPFTRLMCTGTLRVVLTNSKLIVWVGVLAIILLGINNRRAVLRFEPFTDFFTFVSVRAATVLLA